VGTERIGHVGEPGAEKGDVAMRSQRPWKKSCNPSQKGGKRICNWVPVWKEKRKTRSAKQWGVQERTKKTKDQDRGTKKKCPGKKTKGEERPQKNIDKGKEMGNASQQKEGAFGRKRQRFQNEYYAKKTTFLLKKKLKTFEVPRMERKQ